MTKFSDLNLDPKVLKAIAEAGYETPTPIQAGAIPSALEGKDVLGIAQTGTGKTASFTLPMITLLGRGRARARMPRSLVLCPTRELAAQVAENFDVYAKHTKLTKALLIGGVSFKDQDALIDRGVDVLIATPGRLLDHFERGKLLLTGVQIMVVDEADRMLDMGFIPDIERIFNLTPFTRQTLFFSATMAPEIERITNTFLHAPARVEVARAATTGENIAQGVVMFRASRRENADREKRALLRALIDRGVDVLIATPGRLLDHFERGKLLLTGVQIMVVDEADRMLDMGFIPDIERIFNLTPFTRQTLFFSATMAPEIERITNTFLHAPARVEVARAATTGENIAQGVVMFRASRRENADREKRALLRALIDGEGEACTNAIIFCNRKIDVDIVAKSLKKYGYNAEPIHGDLDQSQRMRTLDGFRNGDVRFLIASDVAARGLDIPAVSHVFNFDVPSHAEDYVHRIGRTGRAGRSGKALMICSTRDAKYFEAVEKLIEKEVPRIENPLGNAPAPAEGAEEDKPAPKSSRSRSRGRGKGDKPAETPAKAEAPREETPKREPKPQEKREPKAQERREPRQDRRDTNRVVGMGEDTPSFIRLSFDERRG